jgi:DNA-binding transcriptional ArsR family regulator
MDIFYALADPTRRQILEMLAQHGELPATKIYEQFSVSRPAISQHLQVLRQANLVQVEKRAQQRIYRVNSDAVMELEAWARQITQQWNERFDAIENILKSEKKKGKGYEQK